MLFDYPWFRSCGRCHGLALAFIRIVVYCIITVAFTGPIVGRLYYSCFSLRPFVVFAITCVVLVKRSVEYPVIVDCFLLSGCGDVVLIFHMFKQVTLLGVAAVTVWYSAVVMIFLRAMWLFGVRCIIIDSSVLGCLRLFALCLHKLLVNVEAKLIQLESLVQLTCWLEIIYVITVTDMILVDCLGLRVGAFAAFVFSLLVYEAMSLGSDGLCGLSPTTGM